MWRRGMKEIRWLLLNGYGSVGMVIVVVAAVDMWVVSLEPTSSQGDG